MLPDVGPDAADGFPEAYRAIRKLFFEERGVIESLLETHDGVNRRSYSKKSLPQWLGAVEAYLAPEEPEGFPGDGDLGKFTRSRLLENSYKTKRSRRSSGASLL